MTHLAIDSNHGQIADTIQNHYSESPLGRTLVKTERAALTDLVKKIEAESKEPGWKIWQSLHRTMGVESIDDLRFAHRDCAMELLNLRLRCVELENELAKPAPPITDPNELVAARRAIVAVNAVLKKEQKAKSWSELRANEMAEALKEAKKANERQENLLRDSHDQVLYLKNALSGSTKRFNRLLVISGLLVAALIAGFFRAGLAR